MIHIEKLNYRFRGSKKYALRDMNLDIVSGEFLVITGPSGCGKTTLALAIGGYLFQQFDGEVSGEVTIAGMDARNSPIYDIAEAVGLVQQNPEAQFCTLTVRDEVVFGLENRCISREEICDRMRWALSIVDAAHLEGRDLATLSGGEKQKIAIAAMMATKPQVLIFDEPTSNLDPSATTEIFDVIEHIRSLSSITVIVIEHKIDYLRSFNPRLVVMNDGRIVHDGDMPEISSTSRCKLPDMQTTKSLASDTPLVRVDNLHTGYNGHEVLRGLSLEVMAGDFVSVMGDNGSGKTTFLQCVLGLQRPTEGKVEVLRQETGSIPVSELARKVGFVFQNPDHQLFADSVWEEATFAPRNFGVLDHITEMRVGDLLSRCDLDDYLGDHPYRLSYGEKRRLNLISVLSYAPHLLLLDEILIGQDPANAAFLLDLLREFTADGGGVIMVNHAPEITRCYANRILFFDHGKIVVDAPIGEAFKQLKSLKKDAYVA